MWTILIRSVDAISNELVNLFRKRFCTCFGQKAAISILLSIASFANIINIVQYELPLQLMRLTSD